MTSRELATVLAALRCRQKHFNYSPVMDDFDDIATNNGQHKPLSPREIDALCEKLNFQPTQTEMFETKSADLAKQGASTSKTSADWTEDAREWILNEPAYQPKELHHIVEVKLRDGETMTAPVYWFDWGRHLTSNKITHWRPAQQVADSDTGNPWRKHIGAPRSMPSKVCLVEVEFKDGAVATTPADNLRWTHTGSGGDIVRWRPAQPKPVKPKVEAVTLWHVPGVHGEWFSTKCAAQVRAGKACVSTRPMSSTWFKSKEN